MLQESNVGTALNPNVKKTRIIMAAKLFALKESKGAWLVEIDGMTGFIDHVSGNSRIKAWIKLERTDTVWQPEIRNPCISVLVQRKNATLDFMDPSVTFIRLPIVEDMEVMSRDWMNLPDPQ